MKRTSIGAWVACLALGGAASPGNADVIVERIAHRSFPRVRVPSGFFHRGVTPETASALVAACEAAVAHDARPLCGTWSVQLAGMPPARVFVSEFWIDTFEVTEAAYAVCVGAGPCDPSPGLEGHPPMATRAQVNVSWHDARRFCAWRGGRLPTEAEWEYAAKGPWARAYPWGDALQVAARHANVGRAPRELALALGAIRTGIPPLALLFGEPDPLDGAAVAGAVGAWPRGRSPMGTYDQAGNVAEWVADGNSEDGYAGLPEINPFRGDAARDARIVRGGGWQAPPWMARVDIRDPVAYRADVREPYIGFRCAYDR